MNDNQKHDPAGKGRRWAALLFPRKLWTRPTVVFGAGLLFKFLWFDVIWATQTTFTAFSSVELYVNALLVSLVLLFPYGGLRRGWLQACVMVAVDLLLVANLMYSRTYYAAIPPESYALAGNLADFTASVRDSLRVTDILFPLSTLACLVVFVRRNRVVHPVRAMGGYLTSVGIVLLLSVGLNLCKGGFRAAYDSLQNANYHTCGVPMYTVFGHLRYQYLQADDACTSEAEAAVRRWLDEQPAWYPLPDTFPGRRTSLVVILCESLESWVLERTVDGKEITPCLNRLLRDSSTLYAPRVLTQVAGGRSIDCQLLLNAGLLPVKSGSYSMKYPGNTYFTLTKALREAHGARSYLLTVDKPVVWNQGAVARSFGIDTLLSKSSWTLDERTGSRGKLGDESFFRQAVEKLRAGEFWSVDEPAYVQLVTYSGHNPFIIPESSKRITIEGDYPQRMKDYLVTANYTDHALGYFIDYLRTRPDYDRMLIVVTGDHEGLAADRSALCQSAGGQGVVSDRSFTPFIVLNSPVGMRYEAVMGQVDMYPTLLQLLRLDSYPWKGLGRSILDVGKPPFAVSPQMRVEGDTTSVSPEMVERVRRAGDISDLIIRYDLLAR